MAILKTFQTYRSNRFLLNCFLLYPISSLHNCVYPNSITNVAKNTYSYAKNKGKRHF